MTRRTAALALALLPSLPLAALLLPPSGAPAWLPVGRRGDAPG
jgi:hypothetical protein